MHCVCFEQMNKIDGKNLHKHSNQASNQVQGSNREQQQQKAKKQMASNFDGINTHTALHIVEQHQKKQKKKKIRKKKPERWKQRRQRQEAII